MKSEKANDTKRIVICLSAVLILLGCCVGLLLFGRTHDGILHVRFLDAGQADACLISLNGQHMLIDGGDPNDSQFIYTVLEQNKIKRLKAVINSHPDDDHLGGLPAALKICKTDNVWSSTDSANTERFRILEKYAEQNGTFVRVPFIGEKLNFSGAVLTVLSASKDLGSTNNDSLVIRLDYKDVSFLFTGDIETSAEELLIEEDGRLSADVLKVPHHGSNTSSTLPFLKKVIPRYAVISVGKDNSYGLPKSEVLKRLEQTGALILRTDQLGTIEFTSDGRSLNYTSERAYDLKQSITDPEDTASAFFENAEYIGNQKTRVYHLTTCKLLPDEKNRVYFTSREEAMNEKYSPCGKCNP